MIWRNRPSNGGGVFSLTSWLYVINRVFGCWPFSIEFIVRGSNKTVQSVVCVKSRDWIWFILALVIRVLICNAILVSTILTTLNIRSSTGSRYIGIIINNVTSVSWVLAMLFSIIMDMINRKDIWRIITLLHEFDEEVGTG